MRRMALALLCALLACAGVGAMALIGDRAGSDSASARGGQVALRPRAPAATQLMVASPTRAVLAEMTRRVGTPRRVLIAARRRAREILRIERRLAKLRAAERAAAERRLAALRAAQAAAGLTAPYWYDPAAAAALTRGPATPAEAQWVDSGRGGWLEASGYARPPVTATDGIK